MIFSQGLSPIIVDLKHATLKEDLKVGFEMEMTEPLDQPIKQFFASMWLI